MTIELKKAVNAVVCALKEDRDYYNSWKANIAVAFQDEYHKKYPDFNRDEIWKISNDAAERFLNLLTR